jgi:DNA repair protein RadC
VGAQGIILAHNHPSGSSEPSKADIDATRRLAGLLEELDLLLVDHLIVGRSEITSMRKGGFL